MNEIEILRKVLDPSIKIDKLCLSYVARIFPNYKDSPCLILYKQRHTDNINNCSDYICDDRTNDFDVTGSPLKYSFEDVNFEDSILLIKQNWRKEEEKYLPLSRTEACDALNACLELITDAFSPIFALCDGNDNVRSRLLGTCIQGDWFTTVEVCSDNNESFQTIKESSSAFLEQHLKLSHTYETNVVISVDNTFDVFGIREELLDWDKNARSKFGNSISIEAHSTNLSLCFPTRASKNTLVAQVVTGSDDSPMKELWTQLLLLNQYLNILEDLKKYPSYTSLPSEFPKNFTSPYAEDHATILNNINLLLSGDFSYRASDNTDAQRDDSIPEENLESTNKIKEDLQNLPSRYNLDFTDFLWDLLIKNSNYLEMTKCIHSVLNEIVLNECFVQVNVTNSTRFAKIISNSSQHTIIPNLSGSLPLEYVIDMGFEKLCRDYIYILMSSGFGDLHDIQEKLGNVSSGEFTIDKYRKRLICLAQIHVCLEFMILFQDHLICTQDDLRSLFLCAFKQYVCKKSPIQNCHNFDKNIIYTLSAPLPVAAINNLNNETPTVHRISLSSQYKLSKLTTIKYYSEMPIFPTSICALDESDDTHELSYHITSAICSSTKFK